MHTQMKAPIRQPVVVVAPHLIHPAVSGGDILLERVARYLSQHAPFIDLIGCNSVRRYRAAEVEREESFTNRFRPKWKAAVRTLVYRSHYLHERFNTHSIRRIVGEQLAKEHYGIILASYLTSVPLLAHPIDARCFVLTQNDEFKWFEDLGQTSGNFISRAVARLSLQWLYREVPRLASQAVFIHVSENDRDGFERVVPGHRHLIISVGTDLDAPKDWHSVSQSSRVIISYIGSLGVRMALDALKHFHDRFESFLRSSFDPELVIRIIGSNPLPQIRNLCRENGWQLHADVSDDQFSKLLSESTFSLLPFAYATGAKLKLIRSLGSGVPFLSTLAAQPQGFLTPPGCCFSDDPRSWVSAIRAWRAQVDVDSARQQLFTIAEDYSWPVVVSKIAELIHSFQPETSGAGSTNSTVAPAQ